MYCLLALAQRSVVRCPKVDYYSPMSTPVSHERAKELAITAGTVFTPSAPIDDRDLFAGRLEQLTEVIDAINQKGQHVIVFGERGVGKTSLANVLEAFLPRGGQRVQVCRINCDAGDSFNTVWTKVFVEVQENAATRVGGFAGGSTPARTDVADDIISPDMVRRQLVQWSNEATPILIIDEFDRVNDKYRQIFSDTIKMLSDHSVGATVILVGVADDVDSLITGHESIQRALVQVKMPRMSKEEVNEVIRNGLTRLGMGIDTMAIQRLSLLAQGFPNYAHLLGLHASRSALERPSLTIEPQDVQTGVEKAIRASQQSIRTAYNLAIASPRRDNLFDEVLLACALAEADDLGFFAAQNVRWPMQQITGKTYQIPAFAQHLNEFSDARRGNILKKSGSTRRFRYRFSNPLMPPFVIMRGFTAGKVTDDMLKAIRSQD